MPKKFNDGDAEKCRYEESAEVDVCVGIGGSI
jgi:hypothetical protein